MSRAQSTATPGAATRQAGDNGRAGQSHQSVISLQQTLSILSTTGGSSTTFMLHMCNLWNCSASTLAFFKMKLAENHGGSSTSKAAPTTHDVIAGQDACSGLSIQAYAAGGTICCRAATITDGRSRAVGLQLNLIPQSIIHAGDACSNSTHQRPPAVTTRTSGHQRSPAATSGHPPPTELSATRPHPAAETKLRQGTLQGTLRDQTSAAGIMVQSTQHLRQHPPHLMLHAGWLPHLHRQRDSSWHRPPHQWSRRRTPASTRMMPQGQCCSSS